MSKLGEWLGYINDPCPKCGRMRVESWSSGKLVCEKCHWSILDNEYHREDDSYIDNIRDSMALAFGVPKKVLDAEPGLPESFKNAAIEPEYILHSDGSIQIIGLSLVSKEES